MKKVYDNERKLSSIVNRKKALVFIMKYKNQVLTCETKKFTGVRTIAKIKSPNNAEVFIEFEVIQGRGKLIFIKDKKVYPLIEGNYKNKILFPKEAGLFRLRIVGDNLESKLKIYKQ